MTSSTPRYQSVATVLRDRFDRGIYPTGQPLPSQPRLAREFGVSLATLRQALEVLRREGWVQSRQGGSTRPMRPSVRRALLVEDDPDIRELLLMAAHEGGVEAVAVATAEEAIAEASKGLFAVVLVDVGLPGRDGVYAATEVRKLQPLARVVFVTANPAQALRASDFGLRPVEILPKPFNFDEVIALLGGAARPVASSA